MANTRIPTQKRAIQKRQQILQAGYELFTTIGYYKTDTKKIADKANVSTGIIYSYFHDKMEILEESLITSWTQQLNDSFEFFAKLDLSDLRKTISLIMDTMIELHKLDPVIKGELESIMYHSKAIMDAYNDLMNGIQEKAKTLLKKAKLPIQNIDERLFLIIELIESTIHKISIDKNSSLNNTYLRMRTETLVYDLLSK